MTTREKTCMDSVDVLAGEEFPTEEIGFLVPFASKFTLDNGADGDPPIHIELFEGENDDRWVARVGDRCLDAEGVLRDETHHFTLAEAYRLAVAHLAVRLEDFNDF